MSSGPPRTRRRAANVPHDPPNPLSGEEDEIEEVIRRDSPSPFLPPPPPPPPEDLQDFKSIKIDRLIVLEGFRNYEHWAQQLTMVFEALEADHVVIEGYQPPPDLSATALEAQRKIHRCSSYKLSLNQ